MVLNVTPTLDPPPDYGESSYEGASRLAGRTALVVEADRGIGRAIAIAFAREGANVAIAYSDDEDGARDTAEWVARAGQRAVLVTADARDPTTHPSLIERVVAQCGRLDILVSTLAFEWAHGPLEGTDVTEVERIFRLSNESMFSLSQAAAPHMTAGSSIILTTPMRFEHSMTTWRASATNESATTNLTASLAQQLAADGIRVNAVAPGPVWTPRIVATLSATQITSFGRTTLLGRCAQPAEIAPAYVFLASPAASFVDGAVLCVDGGQHDAQRPAM